MTFQEFLSLVKTIKMLYGRDLATKVFEKNLNSYYNLDSASLFNLKER